MFLKGTILRAHTVRWHANVVRLTFYADLADVGEDTVAVNHSMRLAPPSPKAVVLPIRMLLPRSLAWPSRRTGLLPVLVQAGASDDPPVAPGAVCCLLFAVCCLRPVVIRYLATTFVDTLEVLTIFIFAFTCQQVRASYRTARDSSDGLAS